MQTNETNPALVWFRDDLRLADNPALTAAVRTKRPIICLYLMDDTASARLLGSASRWWLHHSLTALAGALAERSGALTIRQGSARHILPELVEKHDVAAVFWNRRYGAAERALDGDIKAELTDKGVAAQSFNGALIHEPWTVKSRAGGPLRVFTPFWRASMALGAPERPLPAPETLSCLSPLPNSLAPGDLNLLPTRPDWSGGISAAWTPGEIGAAARLASFLTAGLNGYTTNRDRPGQAATSMLSPHLRFGEISPRQIWHSAIDGAAAYDREADLSKFLAEIGWREFSYNLLYHYPEIANRNLAENFNAFPWVDDKAALTAWQKGRTGYPIVDAGMRQLWATGWMHNRVRMVVASFLIKHLMVDWRAGEAWFWDTLVDADPASNPASWQWVAGCGADAAPYYRIFNPILQGEKFDPAGTYVRQWVPELAGLPDKFIHKPWDAPANALRDAGLILGQTYPRPIVDHGFARKRALDAYSEMKSAA